MWPRAYPPIAGRFLVDSDSVHLLISARTPFAKHHALWYSTLGLLEQALAMSVAALWHKAAYRGNSATKFKLGSMYPWLFIRP